ncbi:MAG: autotransporter-associated beta strand repeat-containing protein [Pirellulales bacterium]
MNGGGVLDLNNNNQIVGALITNSLARYAGQGGIVTNSGATTVNFTSIANGNVFGGSINGNLNFNRAGNAALTLTSSNAYTGATNLRANTTTLLDAGALTATSEINLMYASLTIDQGGLNPVGNSNPQRIPVAAPVSLNGGTLTFNAGGSGDYSQTINTVNASQGYNTISVTSGGVPAGSSSSLNLGNLVLDPDATLNFIGGTSGFFSNAPGYGSGQVFITSINGTAIPADITNKILSAAIITGSGEFTTYVQSGTTGSGNVNYGLITMNGTIAGAQATYDSNAASLPASNANSNIRLNGAASTTYTLPAGGANYNVLAVRNAASITVAFAAGTDVLNLTAGGLALTNGTAVVGATAGSGIVTSGGTATGLSRLYIHSTGATVNSSIQNSGVVGASTRLVANSISGTLTLAGVNTYTGGTVIEGGSIVALAATGTLPTGGITINGSTLQSVVASNAIASANDVTINGSGVLTLGTAAGTFTNTLNSLTFNNNGGATAPTVSVLGIAGATLTLNAANAITAVNDNATTVPTIAGTGTTSLLNFAVAPTITTSSNVNVPTDLSISVAIGTSGGVITKAGTGSLALSGASTFTNGVNLNAGAIILGAASTPNTVATAVTSGPLGTGTLTMADGTALISDGTLRTIGNNVALTGNVTFGTTAATANVSANAGNGVTLNGTFDLGGAPRTLTVNSLSNTTTIGGVVGGATGSGLTKAGPGILVLSNTGNTFDGPIAINGGTLQATLSGSLGVGGSITFGGGILQHGTANTTDYSARFATTGNQSFYIDTNGTTTTYATPLVSSTGGNVGKFGTGTLILQAAPTYTGDTNILAGTLQYGTAATSTGTYTLSSTGLYNNGTFYYNPNTADTITFAGGSGTGILTIDKGTVAFTGNANYTGALNFGSAVGITSASNLNLSAASATFASLTQLNNNATGSTVTIGTGQTLTINGNVAIGGNPTVAATNLMTMTGGGVSS